MPMPTLVEMVEAGVHFGHKKERSHPRAEDYIFTLREGVYVIDLDKTRDYLEKALEYLKGEVRSGKTILFVGTKRQAKIIVKSVAEKTGMPYIIKRWLGGTLTNFETIKKNLQELERLENQTKSPEFEALTKKEKKLINDKLGRLLDTFDGVRLMKNLPDVIFIVDCAREDIAVAEANIMEIPIVGTCDTDADPTKITYPIPANDEAAKSIAMIMNLVKTALLEEIGAKPVKEKVEIVEPKTEPKEEKKPKVEKKIKTKNPTSSRLRLKAWGVKETK